MSQTSGKPDLNFKDATEPDVLWFTANILVIIKGGTHTMELKCLQKVYIYPTLCLLGNSTE